MHEGTVQCGVAQSKHNKVLTTTARNWLSWHHCDERSAVLGFKRTQA